MTNITFKGCPPPPMHQRVARNSDRAHPRVVPRADLRKTSAPGANLDIQSSGIRLSEAQRIDWLRLIRSEQRRAADLSLAGESFWQCARGVDPPARSGAPGRRCARRADLQ